MNYYEVLHISQDAPEEIIKLAYKGLAQKYHPDRYKGADANEKMVQIREAYETLIDPIKRKNYDQFLAEQARRKQQQEEEYVKRQQQEEFIRRQKSAFEQQNKAHSGVQSDQPTAHSNHEAPDYKSFKMNISIDVPKDFSIFFPFIYLKNWLVEKKGVFKKLVGLCVGLLVVVLIIALIIENFNRMFESSENQATVNNQQTTTTEAMVPTNYEQNHIGAAGAAQEAVSAADEAEISNEDIYGEEAYRGPQDERLVISSQDIKNASNLVFRTFKDNGMIGVNRLVSDCYVKNVGSLKCVRLDFAGKYLNDAAIAAGLPEDEYFKGEAVLERIYQNFYSIHEYDADIADSHASELLRKMYASMEQEIIQAENGEI